VWVQAFAGLDGGHFRNLATRFASNSTGDWSSASVGIRAIGPDWIGEFALTTVLKTPAVAVVVEGEKRLWVRAGVRF
jgi:hypothetical protein